MDLNVELMQLLSELKAEQSCLYKELESYPQGLLGQTKQNGVYKLMLTDKSGDRRIRKTVSEGTELFSSVIQREYLKNKYNSLSEDCRLLEKLLQSINKKGLSIEDELLKKYTILNKSQISGALKEMRADSWESEEYEHFNYYEEAKRHMTSRGLMVRSKSELLIAEKLYDYGISFRYEQVIHIGTYTVAPDFTIRRRDGKLFYWEHEGLTNSQTYLDRQIKKSQMYAGIGIVPWDNLIVTYDNTYGEVNLRIIGSEIENKLLQ